MRVKTSIVTETEFHGRGAPDKRTVAVLVEYVQSMMTIASVSVRNARWPCRMVSHGEYTDGTDRRTPDRYPTLRFSLDAASVITGAGPSRGERGKGCRSVGGAPPSLGVRQPAGTL